MTVFLRVLEPSADEKPEALLQAVGCIAASSSPRSDVSVFDRSPHAFRTVPGSPFAYWAPEQCLQVFTRCASLSRAPRNVISTNPLNLDFRYARVWWEPVPTALGEAWRPWAKGGAYSPFYYDVNTVIAWSEGRGSYTGFLGTENRPLERPASVQYFFRPGLTWPRRTNGLSFRVMPAGCIFADKGPAAFVDGDSSEPLLALCAIMNSKVFAYLVSIQLARTELAQSYEVGLIQQTPAPDLTDADVAALARLARRAWSLKRSLDTINETSHAFLLPPGLHEKATGLDRAAVERELATIQHEIDEMAFRLYGIGAEDRNVIEVLSKRTASNDSNDGEAEGSSDEDDGLSEDETPPTAPADTILSWLVGVAFGRFDPRVATGKRAIPPEPAPFDSLPSRSPGMWPEGEESECPDLLVDDEGHADDLVARVRVAADGVEVDVAENLRSWLAKELFPLHIKMYSKSRRKAPIYWQLATSTASYSVWLYIHAFSKDTVFRVQNDYVGPKLTHEERRLESMTREFGDKATAAQRRDLAAQHRFVQELRTLLAEVKRVAPLWNPNLDDGVTINFAPLWRLVPQHKGWQRELKSTWDALCEGNYDWAHLAMHLWPERVVPKCANDRSLAIAHSLEDVFWIEGNDGKWTARKTPTRSIDELVRGRTSPAVKAALKNLLEAPNLSGNGGRARGGRRRPIAASVGEAGDN